MALYQYATESMAFMISSNMDGGSKDYHLEAAISKVFASESAWYVCDEAIQILGGMGYMKETGLERVLRDLRIFRIFEGANDILRLFVALSGIQYAGAHLKELQKALQSPANNLGLIFKEVSNRAYRKVGLSGVDLSSHVDPSLADAAKLCAQVTDTEIVHNDFFAEFSDFCEFSDFMRFTNISNFSISHFFCAVDRHFRSNRRSPIDQTRQRHHRSTVCIESIGRLCH